MEFTGKIIAALNPRNGVSKTSGKPWAAQEFVIESHEQYPKRICFDVFGEDKLSQFNLQVGEEVTISFDINASQYQERWFNSIRAWNVMRTNGQANGQTTTQQPQQYAQQPTAAVTPPPAQQNIDELPF